MVSTPQQFDIAIVGAGAVGGSLAYALAQTGFTVALIEKTAVSAGQQPAFDERHLGFSRSTQIALQGLGLWSAMAKSAVAISRIHVSSKGRFGSVMMDASDEGFETLGYVLPAREIGRAIHQAIADEENIQVFALATLLAATSNEEKATLQLDYNGQHIDIEANLLIGADGAESQVREQFGIATTRWEYDQSAVIANLDVRALDTSMAYERFIDGGILALLPRNDDGYAVVCSVADAEADRLMAMDDETFKRYIADCMGAHLNEIQAVGQRYRFPLALVRAKESVRHRLVLIGSAAHYIHPVAAQGFNLSMRDVAALVETLVMARQSGKQVGDLEVLQGYAKWRQQDERVMVAFTDSMVRLFTNPLLPIVFLRQKGLLALRYIPPIRNLFTRAVTGRMGKQPALMRGVGLNQ